MCFYEWFFKRNSKTQKYLFTEISCSPPSILDPFSDFSAAAVAPFTDFFVFKLIVEAFVLFIFNTVELRLISLSEFKLMSAFIGISLSSSILRLKKNLFLLINIDWMWLIIRVRINVYVCVCVFETNKNVFLS